MKNQIQAGLLFIFLTVLAILGYNAWLWETTPPERNYTDFLSDLKNDQVTSVHLQGTEIRGKDSSDREFLTFSPDIPSLMPLLLAKDVIISAEIPVTIFDRLMRMTILIAILLGLWFAIVKRQSVRNPIWKTKRFQPRTAPGETKTFADVAGIDEASDELMEIVDFLQNHEKYSSLGGRIPKGVLLQGPPGTGKTLLARAIAGEASVPFYSMGGADFVEMFAGVGASRVRELFNLAKQNAPCIIFIDEIDAIGGKRSGGNNGSHEEREQTLNALLVEMDGFSSNETVIVIGATNRPDVLDPALLRPGRLDRQVTISLPNLHGRIKVLEVHTRQITTSPAVNLTVIAQGIPGFSGADIANLVNEAALTAARHEKRFVEMIDFEEAKDKILMGLERKNAAINEQERRIIAYHEAGHAIVAKLLPETDELHKITIIPRGSALGLTQQVPIEERYTYSLVYLLNRIKILLGGRIAEKIVFNHLSTGAANDIASATDFAARLVCEWGMSSVIGSTVYHRQEHGFLGNTESKGQYSEETAREIDLEVRKIINTCYSETEKLLRSHNRLIHELAEILLINETIDAEEVEIVMQCYINRRKEEESLKDQDVPCDFESKTEKTEEINGMRTIGRAAIMTLFTLWLMSSTPPVTAMDVDDAPESVTIDYLQELYTAVEFDHTMHTDMFSCSACHHHTTGESATDENCIRCHAQPEPADDVSCSGCHEKEQSKKNLAIEDANTYHIDKPTLKGALHLQCTGCHQAESGPTDCFDCHEFTAAGEKRFKTNK